MQKSLSTLLLLLICSITFSQTTISLKGKIIDDVTKLPIESATVYIASANDSAVLEYTITDKLGRFDFKIKKINKPVYLKISFIGYQDNKIELEKIASGKDFGILTLKAVIKNLDEVVIKNEAPPIRIKKDTLEFNASSFKVRPDANVETLLKQLPGVEIDSDGKITVNGKEVNQILVNGKPFFDKDGKVALQNLPSDIIKKVQVTDTKTKKEEKTGAASSSNNASINLTIDENKNKGLFGKVMAGYGSSGRYESSALVNYFKNKRKISVLASSNNINSIGFSMDEVFDNMNGGRSRSMSTFSDGSFSINGRRYGGGSGITRSNMVGLNYSDEWTKNTEASASYFYSDANTKNENRTNLITFLPTGNFTTNSNSNYSENRYAHNMSSVFEYKLDSLSSIVIEPNFTKSNTKNSNMASQSSFDATNAMLNSSTSDTTNDNDASTFSNTLSFTRSFKKKSNYLSLVFENENGTTTNTNYTKSNTFFYQGGLPDDIRNQYNKSKNTLANYRAEFEYTQPITDSLLVKLGLEYKLNQNNNSRDSYDFDANNQSYSILNNVLTNAYNSLERTFTPNTSINLTKKTFSFNFTMGTNIIRYNNDADYLNLNTSMNKTYLSPNVHAYGKYNFSKTKNIWLSYNYDYDLPNAKQLIPIEDLSSPLNTFIGNPNLELNKYHNFYFSYRDFDYATRSGYGTYMGGNFYDNQIVSSISYDENRKQTTTYDNVSGTYTSWAGIYWNKSIKKEAHKFRIETRLGNNFGLSKGYTDGELFSARSYTFSPRINFSYDYGELLTVNPSYNYTYSKTNYSNYTIGGANSFTHKFNLQLTNYWPKKWVFGNDFGYTYNSNIADGFKKDFFLWNTSLSYSFFEKKFMAKVKVYDLLNQNQSTTRTITPTSIREEENTVLKRYIIFSLTYKLEKFAGKEKKSGGMRMF